MKREWFIFGVGLVIFFLPLLGFPRTFAMILYMLAGALMAVSALRVLRKLYRRERTQAHAEHTSPNAEVTDI